MNHVTFTVEEKLLDLHINFPAGSRFACPVCGEECPVHDTREHTWRHMDFFQHEAYFHARVPRVACPQHGVHQVAVPWAREGSQFTLLFEALIITLVREMPVLTVARMIGETDTLLWRVIKHYVSEARTTVNMADVHAIGVDETGSRRGHDYITLFVDLEVKRLLFATPGKDAQTFAQFTKDLQAHGGHAEAVTEVSMDLPRPSRMGKPRAGTPRKSAPIAPWSPWGWFWTAVALCAAPGCSPGMSPKPARCRICCEASRRPQGLW